MQKRNVLHSPRLSELKKHRRRSFLNKILILLLGFSAICILFIYLSRLASLNISAIEITGNKVVDTNLIQTSVQNEIAGKYLWLVPKTNIVFYPKNQIEKELNSDFPRLKSITLSVNDKNTLEVSVTEREAKYTWCGIAMPIQTSLLQTNTSDEKCYFMDEDGYIFDEAAYFSGDVYFKFYGETLLTNNIPSGSYFSKQNFQQLISLKNTLENIGLKPVSLYITDDGDIQVFLSSSTTASLGPEIILKADADFQNVEENLQAALTTEPLQTEFKTKYSSLEYIDLRYGNKVYYKFASPNSATTNIATPIVPVVPLAQ